LFSYSTTHLTSKGQMFTFYDWLYTILNVWRGDVYALVWNRLVAKTTQLETERKQKETEIQKLMDENMRLNALVDMKEAQLLAMHEQCKVMALSASNIWFCILSLYSKCPFSSFFVFFLCTVSLTREHRHVSDWIFCVDFLCGFCGWF
jgi:hypothetical protein